ncbi:MAG: hypothetical protein Q9192_006724, partial [Flavoplaca navasiana]
MLKATVLQDTAISNTVCAGAEISERLERRQWPCLYNPNYGYFSKQAVIFNPGEAFEFNRIRDELDFQKILGQRYTDFEDKLDDKDFNETRQLWHTPTELFRPYYGEAMARYLVTNYMLAHHPFTDLTIYELGAGNGTLMLNILDY